MYLVIDFLMYLTNQAGEDKDTQEKIQQLKNYLKQGMWFWKATDGD